MATRENEADPRPLSSLSASLAPTSGVVTTSIIHKWVVNVTGAGTFQIRTLDGNASTMGTLPVGVYTFDVQGDMATWTGTMAVVGFFPIGG